MKANFKRYRSVNTKHLNNYQILAIFEQMNKDISASEKAKILFEILKDVKAPLTYEGLLNKQYTESIYGNVLDENSDKEIAPNLKKDKCPTYDYLAF